MSAVFSFRLRLRSLSATRGCLICPIQPLGLRRARERPFSIYVLRSASEQIRPELARIDRRAGYQNVQQTHASEMRCSPAKPVAFFTPPTVTATDGPLGATAFEASD